jgi:hypothetical protein
MIVVFPIALLVCAVVLFRARGHTEGRGPVWFGAWAMTGTALTFSFLAGFSIGLFLLPLALVLLAFVVRASPQLPEAVGFVAGIGVTLLAVAFINRDYEPCPANGVLRLAPGQQSVSCGGFDPHPWLYAGLAVTAIGTLTYLAAARVRR